MSEMKPAHLTVLVVEDNADAAQTLIELLTMWGYDVRHAGPTTYSLPRRSHEFEADVRFVFLGAHVPLARYFSWLCSTLTTIAIPR